MGITAYSGPLVSYGVTQGSTGGVTEYNEERGPDMFDLGLGFLDPRYNFNYRPGTAVGSLLYGFFGQKAVVDYVPTTINTSGISPTATTIPAAGTALTLLPSTGTGSFQTTIIAPENGQSVSVIAIDSTAQYLSFGTGKTEAIWNPAAGAGRNITITPSSNLDGGTWSIAGRDVYGFKMTEAISSATLTTKKAYKYISSILACTTLTSTGVAVGFGDTYGFPLLLKNSGLDTTVKIIAVSSLQYGNSTGAFTLGSTATATNTSSDVRGTYASTTASDGTIRIQMVQNITPAMVSSVTASDTSAMFGASQYSSI